MENQSEFEEDYDIGGLPTVEEGWQWENLILQSQIAALKKVSKYNILRGLEEISFVDVRVLPRFNKALLALSKDFIEKGKYSSPKLKSEHDIKHE